MEKSIDQEQQNEEALCPSCGHFAGTYEYCPRCGACVPKRISIKFFKYTAVFLATVGMLFLYAWARTLEYETIQTKDITKAMNFALVRITGKVVRNGAIRYSQGNRPYLMFAVDDGTGVIQITAFHKIAREIEEQDLVPRQGDQVEAVGQLQVRASADSQLCSLLLRDAAHLKLQRVEAPYRKLAEIDASWKGKAVQIRAKITEINVPGKNSRAPVIVAVADESGAKTIKMWPNVYQRVIAKKPLSTGQNIAAFVTIETYAGKVQLALTGPGQLRIEDETVAESSPDKATEVLSIAEVDIARHAKEKIAVRGQIAKSNSFAKGHKWTLADEGKSLQVTIWQDIWQKLSADDFLLGDEVIVYGHIGMYRNTIQLTPRRAEDIIAQSKHKKIAELSDRDVGKITRISGRVKAISQIGSSGSKVVVADGTGELPVILWNRSFAKSDIIKKIEPGVHLRIRGEVSLYREQLQISPKNGTDIALQK